MQKKSVLKQYQTVLGHMDLQSFEDEMKDLFTQRTYKHISNAAKLEVETCKNKGIIPAILTACPIEMALPLAKELNIKHIIATKT